MLIMAFLVSLFLLLLLCWTLWVVPVTVAKLVDRCPLMYGIVRAISCLVPSTVANHQVLAERRMTNLAQTLGEVKFC